MTTIQNIFRDHFDSVVTLVANSNNVIRTTVFENVRRMLRCGDINYGYSVYVCESCDKFHCVPHTCKSRFCTSCGNLYSKRRATNMSFKLLNCSHRHCVFTIPRELRSFFQKDRSLLNCLFDAVNDTIKFVFHQFNKSEDFTPGFISVLHTFGRSLQWNPHIHVLLAEGGAGNFTPWRVIKYFNFTLLRNSFRRCLLNHLEARIGPSFKKIKSFIYQNCPNGFYVYAKGSVTTNSSVINYIGRYLGRPVIASSRINSYDGQFVTFHYNRHEDNVLVTEKIHATEFIKKLIIHIPEKHFKMIRYYGIYAKNHKQHNKLFLFVKKEKRQFLKSLNSWKMSLIHSFGINPLICTCGMPMTFFHKSMNRPIPELYNILFPDTS